jgi:ATP-dependent DNA helicase RecQ
MNNNYENELLLCLKKYWGYSSFLEGQLALCMNTLQRKDSFAVMATGSGKSLAYQLPAVFLRDRGVRAISLIVSPLIALIDDQISSLLAMGVSACAVGSNSNIEIEQRALKGDFAIVYATPEKLMSWQSGLVQLMKSAQVVCLAVDESHCVSEWGHDFRPDYRRLGQLREITGPNIPWIALTASATAVVQSDILRSLRLRDPLIAKSSLNRPNLKYCVLNRTGPNDLLRTIREFRKEQLLAYSADVDQSLVPFLSTLIYVNSKKESETFAKLLVDCPLLRGIRVAFYHAGMDAGDRSAVHLAFSKDDIQVVVATVAFGMGKRAYILHFEFLLLLE